MSCYCLVYTSIASQKISDGDLKYLLEKIRKKNAARQVTGMLLYLVHQTFKKWDNKRT